MTMPGGNRRNSTRSSASGDLTQGEPEPAARRRRTERSTARERGPARDSHRTSNEELHLALTVDDEGAVSVCLQLSPTPEGPAHTSESQSIADQATLDAACRLMSRIDRELIARALELGPYRPETDSSH